jgi:hypothetical protein
VVWLPAAVIAAVGVVVLARTGERPAGTDAPPPVEGARHP